MIRWSGRAVAGTALATVMFGAAVSPAVASEAVSAKDTYPKVAGDAWPKATGDSWPKAAGGQRQDRPTEARTQACKMIRAKKTITIREKPTSGSKSMGPLPKGHFVCLVSKTRGQKYKACGGTSRVWYKIKVTDSRPGGWVAALCMAIPPRPQP